MHRTGLAIARQSPVGLGRGRTYNEAMARTVGKLLQLLGLVLLPAAMVMQLTSQMRAPTGMGSVSAMLLLMVFGFGLFMLGRIVEGYGNP